MSGETSAGSLSISLPTLSATMDFGAALGGILQPGALVILAGDLGAGKTALTKGIATGMGITETITSPTFVIARVHHGTGSTLVHVDAYRLGDALELDDLDLDTDLDRAAVVVEWGDGIADGLAANPLRITMIRHDDDSRTAVIDNLEAGAVRSTWVGQWRDLPSIAARFPLAG